MQNQLNNVRKRLLYESFNIGTFAYIGEYFLVATMKRTYPTGWNYDCDLFWINLN